MVKTVARIFVSLILILTLSTQSWAQTQDTPAEGQSRSLGGTRRQIALIIFSGLGGAILGLSTLSFYGRPQDKLSNIAIGFALGVIGGTIYVTYKAASSPKDFYKDQSYLFDPVQRADLTPPPDYMVNYRLSF